MGPESTTSMRLMGNCIGFNSSKKFSDFVDRWIQEGPCVRGLTGFDVFLPIPMSMGYAPANIQKLLEKGKFEEQGV